MTRNEHLMTIAMEECAEVAQRLSKALRFGMDESQASAGHGISGSEEEALTNAERIRKEYSQLAAVLEMIGIGAPLGKWMDEKREKVEYFLRYSAEVGTLDAQDHEKPAHEAESGSARAPLKAGVVGQGLPQSDHEPSPSLPGGPE